MSRRRLANQSATGGHRRSAAVATGAGRRGELDTWCVEQARRIQESHRGWLVMWSVWHRTFTAFGCFSPDRLIIDESTVEELAAQLLRVELHYRPVHP